MQVKECLYVDRSRWEPGPWDSEPDKVQFESKLPCLMVRGPVGSWCGYVGVPPGHPLYAVDYNRCPNKTPCDGGYCEHSPSHVLSAHGGITFSDFCQEDGEEHGICHVPEPGEPEKVWWFGFDCAHYQDLSPGRLHHFTDDGGLIYRTLDYVRSECIELAKQLTSIK